MSRFVISGDTAAGVQNFDLIFFFDNLLPYNLLFVSRFHSQILGYLGTSIYAEGNIRLDTRGATGKISSPPRS